MSASSDTDERPILIIGAGPAGMAAAMELSRAGRTLLVLEKEAQIGGLAKTLEFRESDGIYRTDIGPHRFFSKNKYLYDYIGDLLGEQWQQVSRFTRFYADGHLYSYPIRIGEVLRTIGLVRVVRVMWDYMYARFAVRVTRRTPRSFEEYAVDTFGRTLAEFNMLNYTEKIWGIPCKDISVDWALQRIGGLSPLSMLRAVFVKRHAPKSLIDAFYYPSHGSGRIYEAIRERIEQQGQQVWTETEPMRLCWEGNRVTSVQLRGAHEETINNPSAIVSSVPLPVVVRLFDPPPPSAVLQAALALRFRSQVYLFLTVDRERITRDNWIYFPAKEIPFGRISEMKNFSSYLCPEGKTSLFIEFFCFEGDSIWTMDKDALFATTMDWLERLLILNRKDVRNIHHFRLSNVYPLYDQSYRAHVSTILSWADSLDNFYAVGRPGRFRYTNQDHSLEMGILTAQYILDGERRNIDDVGAEREYFEKGFAPDQNAASS